MNTEYPYREYVYNRLRKLNLDDISISNPYRTTVMYSTMLVIWQDILLYLPYPYNSHYISKTRFHKYAIRKHSKYFLEIEVSLDSKTDEWVIEIDNDAENVLPFTGENMIHIIETKLLKVIENEVSN